VPDHVTYAVKEAVLDAELSRLHRAAFDHHHDDQPWNERLERHSLTWVTARQAGELVGFINVIGDGGVHAVMLDTAVLPGSQGQGIGRHLVREAASAAERLGCEWLHVDYEDRLAPFYEGACAMRPTRAALLALTDDG
jgi:ribosomal protein S18 acetylase RimI-like enzyme